VAGCVGAIIGGRRESFLQQAVKLLRQPAACEAVVDFVRQNYDQLDILINDARADQLFRHKHLDLTAVIQIGKPLRNDNNP
jgi:short-subunit dehydrogenase involved in D-alanine esterification of teichoic acids